MTERRNINILIIDEDLENLVVYEAVLDQLCENVVRAQSKEEALRHLAETDIAVVLLDAQMSTMNGFEMAKVIRSRARSRLTPVIFVTDAADAGDLAKASYALGAVDFITKPVIPEMLRAKVAVFAELQRSREELRRKNAFLEAVLNHVADGVVACDEHGVLSLFNRATIELHGLPQEAVPAEDWAQHYDLYSADGVTPLPKERVPLFRALAGEHVKNTEMVIAPKGRSPRTLLASGQALFDDSGQKLGAVVSMHDVTERRRAVEAVFREQRELWQTTLSSIGDAVIATDPNRRVTFLNPEAERLTGWTRGDAVGRSLDDVFRIVNESTRVRVPCPVSKVLETGRVVGLANHTVLLSRDGPEWPIDDSAAPIRDADGNLYGVVLVFRDIIERKEAGNALAASERRLREFFDTAPAILWVTDCDAGCSYLSRGWYEFTGQTEGQGLGFGWLDAVHPDDRAETQRVFVGANERRQPFALEHRVRRYDGNYRWVIDAGRPRLSAEGEYLGYVGNVLDITDRKESEAAVIAAERQVRLITDAVPALISYVGLDRHYRLVNQAYEQWFGIRRAEVLDRPVAEVLGEAAWAVIGSYIERAFAGEVVAFEAEVPYRAGGTRWIHATYAPDMDEVGQVRGVVVLVHDISARRRADDALRASEERHRNVLENLNEGFVLLDREYRFVYMNAAAERLNGHRREDVLGRSQWEVFPAAVGTTVYHGMHRAMEERVTIELENYYEPWDRWFAVKTAPTVDGGISLLYRDVTDAKRNEAALTETAAAERHRSDLLARVADASRRINVSLSAASISQVLAEESRAIVGAHQAVVSLTLGDDWSQAINAVSLSEKYATWRDYAARPNGSGIYSLVCRTNTPMRMTQEELEQHPAWTRFGGEGEKHPPMRGWLAVPLIGRDGKNLGLIQLSDSFDGEFTEEDEAVLSQLAAIAAAGLENARLFETLRESNERKDEFLATLAHELRNPLAPIRSGLSILQMGTLDASGQKVVPMMERQLRQLVHLVDDLLDVSRVTTGKISLRSEPLDLRNAVEAAVETIRPDSASRHHEVMVRLCDSPLPVQGDATRLTQVVTNLLNNACKYTPDGGRIVVSAECVGGHGVVRVQDNGVGIPAEMLPKVFDTFTQVIRSLDRSHGGLGLGLSLVRRLVEMHGGDVQGDSPGPGQGSTFTVRLPLSEAVGRAEQETTNDRAAGRPLPTFRVLVVDDLAPAADLMAMMLKRLGQETQTAYDGLAALTAIAEFRPDIVVSDIGMPGMDGYELAKRIRAISAVRPLLVAVTGYGQEEDRQQAFAAGFDRHLVKPAGVDSLQELLVSIAAAGGAGS